MTPLTVLRLISTDISEIESGLTEKIKQAPAFFQDAPLLIDMGLLAEKQNSVNLPSLARLLRKLGFVPVGLRGGNKLQKSIAITLQLGLFPEAPTKNSKLPVIKTEHPQAQSSAMFIKQKVRSGQRIHAKNKDLIILNSVSPGAEVIADGHIHVYGALHGRAMAGGRDNIEARIFCQSLHAELVSVAGHYRVNEDLHENIRGRQVQIFLKDEKQLVIEELV